MSSRHDHFPRGDTARRLAMRRAVADLDAAWRAADSAPDGLLTAIVALADAPADVAIARLLPWLSDTDWLRDRLDAALTLLAAVPFAHRRGWSAAAMAVLAGSSSSITGRSA